MPIQPGTYIAKEYVRTCINLNCHKEFISHSPRAQYCPECWAERVTTLHRESQRKRAKAQKEQGRNPVRQTETNMQAIVRITCEGSKNGGLSYGYRTAEIEQGRAQQ